MYRARVVIEFSVEVDSVVLASFIARARGIKFYDVDPKTLVPGLAVALQRKCSRYDANGVGLLVPSRRQCLFGSPG